MDLQKKQLLEMLSQVAPNRYLQALLIILLFGALAKILDVLIIRVIKRWITKTELTIDDQILDILHNPIFVSIILLGLGLATERLEFSQTFNVFTIGGLQTIAIFLWAIAAARLMKLFLELVSVDESRFIFTAGSAKNNTPGKGTKI